VTPGEANNVRDTASRSGALVGQISGGSIFSVLDGPVCADGLQWWQVEYGDLTGWTVEGNGEDYFLMPLEGDMVSYENISFILPAGIATSAEGAFIEGVMPTEDEPWDHLPAYVEFTFADYPDEEHDEYDTPRLRLYEATAFDDIDNMLGGAGQSAVAGLNEVLAGRPDLYSFNVVGNRIPDDRPGAANVVLAQMTYLDFQNGSGYRYITFYAQDFYGPDNEGLVYRYLGLTDDGAYFVSGLFPINAPQLPEDFDREAAADEEDFGFGSFQEYSLGVTALFDSIAPQDYTPDLSGLDALVASLNVKGA
jgi:hypothetical protein